MKTESRMEEKDVETSEIDPQNLHLRVGMVMSGLTLFFFKYNRSLVRIAAGNHYYIILLPSGNKE